MLDTIRAEYAEIEGKEEKMIFLRSKEQQTLDMEIAEEISIEQSTEITDYLIGEQNKL